MVVDTGHARYSGIMDLSERIKELLGQGLTTSVVASAVGCDPSYVSQLLDNQEFHNDVLVARATKAEASVRRDTKWNDIEDLALAKAAELLPLVHRPADLVRMAAMANAAKRRATEFAGGNESASSTVNIVLPASATVLLQMNSNSQVVDVDGRSTMALPAKHLLEQLEARKLGREHAGVVTIESPRAPSNGQPVSTARTNERKKVMTILEQIGFSDQAEPVLNVLT